MFHDGLVFQSLLLPICITLTIFGCGYALFAGWAVRRFAAEPIAIARSRPDIVVLKPLHGAEPELAATLSTLCRQDYAGRYSIVFGVSDAHDAATAEVARLQAQFPGVPSLVQVYGPKLEIAFWNILLAPAGTPPQIISSLNMSVQDVLDDPDILRAWALSGMTPYPPEQRSPAGAAAYLHKEIEHWGAVVRENNIEAPAN